MSQELICKAPEYIGVVTCGKEFIVSTILAGLTLVAVTAAVLHEWLRQIFTRCKLQLRIDTVPPDTHQIELIHYGQQMLSTGLPLVIETGSEKTIYVRAKITHIKGSAGENTEVYVSAFRNLCENGQLSDVPNFLPMNLVWSHFQPRTNVIRVPKKLFRHCDFGHFVNENGEAVFKLDTIVEPNVIASGERPNNFKGGKYQFELLMSGDNVIPEKKTFNLEFSGDWSDDEQEMLDDICIEEVV